MAKKVQPSNTAYLQTAIGMALTTCIMMGLKYSMFPNMPWWLVTLFIWLPIVVLVCMVILFWFIKKVFGDG